jgi:hypothetical protein
MQSPHANVEQGTGFEQAIPLEAARARLQATGERLRVPGRNELRLYPIRGTF